MLRFLTNIEALTMGKEHSIEHLDGMHTNLVIMKG